MKGMEEARRLASGMSATATAARGDPALCGGAHVLAAASSPGCAARLPQHASPMCCYIIKSEHAYVGSERLLSALPGQDCDGPCRIRAASTGISFRLRLGAVELHTLATCAHSAARAHLKERENATHGGVCSLGTGLHATRLWLCGSAMLLCQLHPKVYLRRAWYVPKPQRRPAAGPVTQERLDAAR